MRRLLRVGALGLVTIIVIGVVLVVNALRVKPPDPPPVLQTAARVDATAVAGRLGEALRFATVSAPAADAVSELEPFRRFHRWLAEHFPLVHARLERERIGGASLLYVWRGASTGGRPLLFSAHQDVVPAGDRSAWHYPPFGGQIADGYIWGRGALDDKASLVGLMEALESLLAADFVPSRDLYFAFGHDEERGGDDGAASIARELAARGLEFDWVLDEGGLVVAGILPVPQPVALIGIAEKGHANLVLRSRGVPGHASKPPGDSAPALLARALVALERARPEARLTGATRAMVSALAPHVAFPQRIVYANSWLFEPLLVRALLSDPATAALMRTTYAPTMLEAGTRANVLPPTAEAMLNVRIHPSDSVQNAIQHVERSVDDRRIEVLPRGRAWNPSPVSSTESAGYRAIRAAVLRAHPQEPFVAPWLTIAATDARHYAGLARDVYRFVPFTLGADDIDRIHGIDERIGIEDYVALIDFYRYLLGSVAASPEAR